jgi:hypothetical protein
MEGEEKSMTPEEWKAFFLDIMTSEEWKAAAVIAGPCVAFLALIVSTIAFWQARKTMRAQTFLAALKTGQEIHLTEWMDYIRRLNFNDYDTFQRNTCAEQQRGVRSVIDFFNHLGHLAKFRYLTRKQVVRLYWPSLKDIRERLLPWWLDGFRNSQVGEHRRYYYETFEWLVDEARRYR